MKFKSLANIPLLIVTLLVSGCSSSEKTTSSFYSIWWSDFVSYFNVYYNASKEYDKAQQLIYKASAESGTEINSVFPSIKRGSVGTKELNNAISKATSILQNHPESDIADDALITIGKSYYYIGDLPPAERKFTEVISNYPNSEIVFEATLFLARTYLEQNKIDNALSILNDLIKREDVPAEVKGEANLILGERLYVSGNFKDAYSFLQNGIDLFNDNEAIARAYYLLSKINAIQGDYTLQLTNLKAAKAETSIPATWYLVGVQNIRTYIKLDQFDNAQSELDRLISDDDLIGYRKNFVLEQARIYLAKGEFEIAEKSYKEFIQANQTSAQSAALIPYAYLDLADLRMQFKPNIEVARYFYEKASAGNILDSAIIKAKSKESVIKNYLTLKVEFDDLRKIISTGIIAADTTKKIKVADEADAEDEIGAKNRKTRNAKIDDEDVVQPVAETQPQNETDQRNTDGSFSREEGDSRGSNQNMTVRKQTTAELILDDDALTEKFISTNYQSKFKAAKDSISYRALRTTLETQYEKLVEYFYFQSNQMDSVISYASMMETDFPASKKLARVLYAKSIAYQRLNLENEFKITMERLSSEQGSTRFGKEAKSKLGLADSAELYRLGTEKLYNKAVSLFDQGKYDSSRTILKVLEKQDTSLTIYPKVLFALGFISEKYDKDWAAASGYYTKVQKNYASTSIAKELSSQFAIINPVEEAEKVAVDPNAGDQEINPNVQKNGAKASDKTKPGETKFVITQNAPIRFKRQPKLADVSW